MKAKSFNAGLNLGAGVELIKHLQVGFNYALGLTDDYSASKFELNGKNRGWSITAAILFKKGIKKICDQINRGRALAVRPFLLLLASL